MEYSIESQGDQCALLLLSGEVLPRLCEHAHLTCRNFTQAQNPGIVDVVPAYSSLAVYYDPSAVTFEVVSDLLQKAYRAEEASVFEPSRTFRVPVCYTEKYGQDLGFVASSNGLSIENVITLHSAALYTVAMIGFTPGFPYLLGLPDQLATPRKDHPRPQVAAGSVGIGGAQTGIYSLDSPGGWNIIGRTPLRLFRPTLVRPSLLAAGDTVQSEQIDEDRYHELKRIVDSGGQLDD